MHCKTFSTIGSQRMVLVLLATVLAVVIFPSRASRAQGEPTPAPVPFEGSAGHCIQLADSEVTPVQELIDMGLEALTVDSLPEGTSCFGLFAEEAAAEPYQVSDTVVVMPLSPEDVEALRLHHPLRFGATYWGNGFDSEVAVDEYVDRGLFVLTETWWHGSCSESESPTLIVDGETGSMVLLNTHSFVRSPNGDTIYYSSDRELPGGDVEQVEALATELGVTSDELSEFAHDHHTGGPFVGQLMRLDLASFEVESLDAIGGSGLLLGDSQIWGQGEFCYYGDDEDWRALDLALHTWGTPQAAPVPQRDCCYTSAYYVDERLERRYPGDPGAAAEAGAFAVVSDGGNIGFIFVENSDGETGLQLAVPPSGTTP